MSLKDILAKTGILRSGKVTWSGKPEDRPIEMIMGNVYDSKKDLITNTPSASSPVLAKILLAITIVIAIIVLLAFIGGNTYNVWFFANIIAWGGFIFWLIKSIRAKQYKLKNLLGILALIMVASFFTLVSIPSKTESIVNYSTKIDPIKLVDMSVDLETNLKLEDVRIIEVEGGILEIRTKSPVNVSPEAIMSASAYIFSYIDPSLPSGIKTLRLILTVNDFDATIIETSRDNLAKFEAKQITDQEFINSMKRTNLIK